MQTTFSISGLHCASCKTLIESTSSDEPGVLSATVSAQTNTLTVVHNPSFDPERLIRSVDELHAGYSIKKL